MQDIQRIFLQKFWIAYFLNESPDKLVNEFWKKKILTFWEPITWRISEGIRGRFFTRIVEGWRIYVIFFFRNLYRIPWKKIRIPGDFPQQYLEKILEKELFLRNCWWNFLRTTRKNYHRKHWKNFLITIWLLFKETSGKKIETFQEILGRILFHF